MGQRLRKWTPTIHIEVDSQRGQFCFGVDVVTYEDIDFGAGFNTVADVDSVINTVSMM